MEKYQKITLVYSVRTQAELAFALSAFRRLLQLFGEGHTGFRFVPIITRDPQAALHQRLPILIENGQLEAFVGQPFNSATSHIMLCGNPQIIRRYHKEALKQRGLSMNRRGEGNIAVENYW